jgi:hypothetical protein
VFSQIRKITHARDITSKFKGRLKEFKQADYMEKFAIYKKNKDHRLARDNLVPQLPFRQS